MVTADSAVVDNDVPSPESYSVPLCPVNTQPVLPKPYLTTDLLDLKALLVAGICAGASLGDLCLGRRRICHINVRHGCCECGGCGEVTELLVGGGGGRRLYARWLCVREQAVQLVRLCYSGGLKMKAIYLVDVHTRKEATAGRACRSSVTH